VSQFHAAPATCRTVAFSRFQKLIVTISAESTVVADPERLAKMELAVLEG
jgi:hypothetical protein